MTETDPVHEPCDCVEQVAQAFVAALTDDPGDG